MIAAITVMKVLLSGPLSTKCDAAEMLPLLERYEIQVLLQAGFGPNDVAKRPGVCVDSVERVRGEPGVAHVDDTAERRSRRIGRPSKASLFADRVSQWLEEEPELPTQELLRRAIEQGDVGHMSAF